MTIKSWLGQSTTGTGIATILASLGAVASGTLSWQQALPLAIGGLAGVIWPESTGLNAQASAVAGDIEKLISAGQKVASAQSTTTSPANAPAGSSGTGAPGTNAAS